MRHLPITLAATMLTCLISSIIACTCVYEMGIYTGNHCCVHSGESAETQCTNDDEQVNWTIEDEQSGVVFITFPIEPANCNITKYDIDLYVSDMDSEQCLNKIDDKNSVTNDNNNLHTKLEYIIGNISTCGNTCEQTGKLTFQYIFTGCYFLKIKTAVRTKLIDMKYIQTEYVKKTAASYGDPEVYFTGRASDHHAIIYFGFAYLRKNPAVQIHIGKTLTDGAIYNLLAISDSAEDYTDLYVCNVQSNVGVKWNVTNPKCTYKQIPEKESGRIECHFSDLPAGSYTALFVLLDEPVRCRTNTIWGDETICKWSTEAYISYDIPLNLPDIIDDGNALKYSLVTGSLLLVILAVVVYLIMRRGRGARQSADKTKDPAGLGAEKLIDKKKIFLLYARDCPIFMNMMEAFRTTLNYVGNFEVYDLYDIIRYNKIAPNPEGWIQDKLQNYKTILILSKCAAIHNEQSHSSPSIYRLPDAFDNFFLIALRHLNQNIALASYKKLLVVNLSFDTDNYKSFNFLNPFTRFDLPDKFLYILADLNDDVLIQKETDPEDCVQHENSISFRIFLKKYKEFEEYYKKKPNYLEDIIYVNNG